MRCISLSGEGEEELQFLSDVMLNISTNNVQRVLEAQMLILHMLCDLVHEHIHSNQHLATEPLFDATGAITMSRRLVE